MSDYRLTCEGIVPQAWIDENDHVNMMWYTHLIDAGTDSVMRSLGMDRDGRQGSYVVARLNTAYRRELRLGDPWQVWSAVLEVSDRTIVCAHRIMSGSVIAARSDVTVVLFDRDSRQSIALPPDLKISAEAARLSGLERLAP
ncbi:MAG: acyl-CoA thioesterase [Cypionkella sp.]